MIMCFSYTTADV